MDLQANLNSYIGNREPAARYASFDYCFNYFQAYYEQGAQAQLVTEAQLSCLHLGFYLASWGMFRGSGDLLSRSARHYIPVVDVIASTESDAWGIDVPNYTDGNVEKLLALANRLRSAFPGRASDTLVTKIMLGVFGNVPAFDSYFKRGFRTSSFGRRSLMNVAAFYRANQSTVDRNQIHTLDFDTGMKTARLYPRAKIVDMAFFVEGQP